MEPGITLQYLKDLLLGQNLNNHLIYINFLFSRSFLNIIERGILFFPHDTQKSHSHSTSKITVYSIFCRIIFKLKAYF